MSNEVSFPVGTIVKKRGQRRWLGEVIGERSDKGGRYVEIRDARNGGVRAVAPDLLVAKRVVTKKKRERRRNLDG
jgi:hypothetical protein